MAVNVLTKFRFIAFICRYVNHHLPVLWQFRLVPYKIDKFVNYFLLFQPMHTDIKS